MVEAYNESMISLQVKLTVAEEKLSFKKSIKPLLHGHGFTRHATRHRPNVTPLPVPAWLVFGTASVPSKTSSASAFDISKLQLLIGPRIDVTCKHLLKHHFQSDLWRYMHIAEVELRVTGYTMVEWWVTHLINFVRRANVSLKEQRGINEFIRKCLRNCTPMATTLALTNCDITIKKKIKSNYWTIKKHNGTRAPTCPQSCPMIEAQTLNGDTPTRE